MVEQESHKLLEVGSIPTRPNSNWHEAHIALGSNLGDRGQFILRGLEQLAKHPAVRIAAVSSLQETEPVGGPAGQGPYLNAAASIWTELQPRELLSALLAVEKELGRTRGERFGPRTLDLDLLLFDAVCLKSDELQLPHPRMHERLFVLAPLAEIAPSLTHPITGRTIAEMRGDWPLESAARGGPLAGLRALVTGSTSGIGKAIALALAKAGAEVVVHGKRSIERANAVADEARSLGSRAYGTIADLADPSFCSRLVAQIWEKWGELDVWVNNAGVDTLTGPAAHWSFEDKLSALWRVDVNASIRLSRDVGSRMKQRGSGVILNIGWDQAETGMEGDSGQLFGATKGAIMAFTRSLALSLAPAVRVNCLAPGWIRTSWGEGAPQRWQERVLRETPLARWGTPADVASAAVWLASPEADYVTGQIVKINGGAVRT